MGLASAWALATRRPRRHRARAVRGRPLRTGRATARRASSASRTTRRSGSPSRRKRCRCGGSSRRSRATELLSLTGLLDATRTTALPLRAALDAQLGRVRSPRSGGDRATFRHHLEGEVVLELHGGMVRADRSLAAFRRRVPVEEDVRVLELAADGDGVRSRRPPAPIEARPGGRRRRRLGDPVARRTPASSSRRSCSPGDRRVLRPAGHRSAAVVDRLERGHGTPCLLAVAPARGVLKVGLHHSGTTVEPARDGRARHADRRGHLRSGWQRGIPRRSLDRRAPRRASTPPSRTTGS